MRLFAALTPSAAALDQLGGAIAGATTARGLRWMPRQSWHVTLVFLGEIADDHLGALLTGLDEAATRHTAMTLRLSGAGTFPRNARSARVLWAGLAGDTAPLTALATSLEETARDHGVAVQRRPYVPHLTVARCPRPVDLTRARAGLAALDTVSWQAGEVELIHSNLGGEPRYRTIAAWPLRITEN
ncbi:RNA 2',3'-cyclic phosphodiesterase [Salinactinospora qingdaonensis]|uniref:RNA 2',3'-cyclic phosphodiesterase n=1 Tax=Salinactinospora qingdaonensis TaxID=702744 RepID=A0ABP7G9H0_9ACTN